MVESEKDLLQNLLESMWQELVYIGYGTERVKMMFETRVADYDLDGDFLSGGEES